eukprot:2838069-Pyramimonas_sp.AAC.1
MREGRLSERIMDFIHLPTAAVIVDGLMKAGAVKLLMEHATTGMWHVHPPKGQGHHHEESREDDSGNRDLHATTVAAIGVRAPTPRIGRRMNYHGGAS